MAAGRRDKVVGSGSVGLHLPAAIAGCVAVVALYDALRTLFGRPAGLAGGIALAVLPVAVITARSDTMDSVVAALDIVALALVARAVRSGAPLAPAARGARARPDVPGQAVRGARRRPGLALMAWLGLPRGRPVLAGAGAVLVAAALASARRAPVLGGGHLPWAYGSTHGSAWNAAFVYDGSGGSASAPDPRRARRRSRASLPPPGRCGCSSRATASDCASGSSSPPRCSSPRGVGACRATARPRGLVGALAWLVTGVVLASAQGGLRPRYLEGVDPRSRRSSAPARCSRRAAGCSPPPARCSGRARRLAGRGRPPRRGLRDPGALAPGRIAALTRWERTRGGGIATSAVARGAQLVAAGDRNVVFLAAGRHPLVAPAGSPAARVRAALLGGACGRDGPRVHACRGVDPRPRDRRLPPAGAAVARPRLGPQRRNEVRKSNVRRVEEKSSPPLMSSAPGQPCWAPSTRSWTTSVPPAQRTERSSRTLVRDAAHLRLAGAAVEPPPLREEGRDVPADRVPLPGVGDDLVGRPVDLEDRHRARRVAVGERAVAARHGRRGGDEVGCVAGHPRAHAASVGHAGHAHAGGVGARRLDHRGDDRAQVRHVLRVPWDVVGDVPQRARAGGRGVGDRDALGVGQPRVAGVGARSRGRSVPRRAARGRAARP